MKTLYMTVCVMVSVLIIAGCAKTQSKKMIVNIALKNSSTNALDWVELQWEGAGPDVPGGILSPGIIKDTRGVEWPQVPSVTVTFVDDKTRKPHEIRVSLDSINDRVSTG